ncbi:hypothetical protein L1987_17534 [Smallanthus sonchifolius]|uniref:Uncharacterized protein n=1 Tax=Smallanthus sonchifolius TaxID=185202 RepID=A0ACB9IYA4_9ASTR|nr:hypothetical protein L1987_17534 [Smallanthus sonchifolius]
MMYILLEVCFVCFIANTEGGFLVFLMYIFILLLYKASGTASKDINNYTVLVFPENLPQVAKESDYPGQDVFVSTADPFKEPPIGVVNTVLSVKYDIMDRSPEVYFANDASLFPETSDIQVLLKSDQDKDVTGHCMPNLIYLAREKNKASPHHFKAGALNALIRVSNVITNAPIILILDCDMYSNDPKTPLHALSHFIDPNNDPKLAFIQFPQRFDNLNENDIYAGQHVLETRACTLGMDGLGGMFFMGTGGFFRRQALIEYPTEPHGAMEGTG